MGGLDLNSSNRGCARLGSKVAPPLGVVIEEVAVLIVLVRRHSRAVVAAVRWAVDDEVLLFFIGYYYGTSTSTRGRLSGSICI